MKKIKILIRYIKYLRTEKTKFKIHSPFVYELITKVFEDSREYEAYDKVKTIRKELFSNDNPLEISDFGAGAKSYPYSTSIKKIKHIVKQTGQSPKYSQLLFRIVKYFKPKSILELGTSFGLSTIYQSLASPESKIITIEGCANTADKAQRNFNTLKLKNIKLVIGNFNTTLPKVLKKYDTLDYVFIDGNHRKEQTIKYFEQCLPLSNNNSVFVFDDIHWSKGMEEAWEYIKKHPKVSVTIDIFFMGFVFFKKELSKQDFIIKF
ncbi:MAG: class I SAM-dependent methyltransferase [Bacteroidales bacterium]|nr:class I SAM-dependent methyltransferase [Bacteroidales bacterium]